MSTYIDPRDGQIVEILDRNVSIINDEGKFIPAIYYRCHKRNTTFTESVRRFNAIYRKRVDVPDTGE